MIDSNDADWTAEADSLRRMVGGFAATQMLVAAVELGIADQLRGGPSSASSLALSLGLNGDSLYRFLRMLAVLDILRQLDDETFELRPMGQLLLADHPHSLRDRVAYIGEVSYQAALGTAHAVRTGSPAFDHVFGVPFFSYFDQHPSIGDRFNRMMQDRVNDRVEGVVDSIDVRSAATIVDVGGGNGSLLKAILLANPETRGTVFDVAKVVDSARMNLEDSPLQPRVEFSSGDFFADPVPKGADVYLLSNILHDWDDDRALMILRNCRRAMTETSRLIVVEELMPATIADAPATVAADFSMLLLTGGRERTVDEYRRLFLKAELELEAVRPVLSARSHSGRRSNWSLLIVRPSG